MEFNCILGLRRIRILVISYWNVPENINMTDLVVPKWSGIMEVE